MVKIVIKADAKEDVRNALFKFNIHESSLFPDLDGLSRYLSSVFNTINLESTKLQNLIQDHSVSESNGEHPA
jgi:hypothetical protein